MLPRGIDFKNYATKVFLKNISFEHSYVVFWFLNRNICSRIPEYVKWGL